MIRSARPGCDVLSRDSVHPVHSWFASQITDGTPLGFEEVAPGYRLLDTSQLQFTLTKVFSNMLGADKIADFASKLGLSNEEAAGGLSEALPQMVDKASSGGSLLDSIGGISGAVGLASKLFGK